MLGRLNGVMPEPTRVEAGRRRAQLAKRAVALAAAAGFAVSLALVRVGHPATATSPSAHTRSQSGSSLSPSESERDDSTLGGGSIAPPSSVPASVATATS
jgi:hypothetical protein